MPFWSASPALPLAPMVMHLEFVFDRDARGFEIGNGTDDVTVSHVTRGVVVTADHKNTGMPAAAGADQEVKHAVIVVISRQKDKRLLNGVQQVFRVIDA